MFSIFFLSIYVVGVFILFVGFVLGLEMYFFCLVLFFGTFQFMGFESYSAYILMSS